jgi:hypothetical protein
MAKKQTEVTEEVTLAQAKAEETKVESTNLVTMTDGTQIDFAKRKAIVTVDEVTGEVNFKLVNGAIIDWTVPEVPALTRGIELASSEFSTEVLSKVGVKAYITSMVDRIKNSISALKTGEELEAAIHKQIEALNTGSFITRASGNLGSPVEFAAWEVVKTNDIPQDVIDSILAVWDAKDAISKRNMDERVPAYMNAKYQLMLEGAIEGDLATGL